MQRETRWKVQKLSAKQLEALKCRLVHKLPAKQIKLRYQQTAVWAFESAYVWILLFLQQSSFWVARSGHCAVIRRAGGILRTSDVVRLSSHPCVAVRRTLVSARALRAGTMIALRSQSSCFCKPAKRRVDGRALFAEMFEHE